MIFSVLALFLIKCTDEPVSVNPQNPTATTFTIGQDMATNRPSVTINDMGEGIGSRSLSADTVYILENLVFVNSGQVLTISAGTVIKGNSEKPSGLIVARDATINAVGTTQSPIIFTYKDDPLTGEKLNISGLWGGLIVLGNASLNTEPNEQAIEGIPTTETRGIYGGTDDEDNSGILRYISIRYGGLDIGAGNEINGLTLGGVGRGTTVEFIEVINNADDGVEFFGGTVNTKYISVAFCGDDAIDYDQGYRGLNQFIFVFQDMEGDRAGEHDGGTSPEVGIPFATPQFCNVTYSGNGINRALTFRDNAGGHYVNSIFVNYGQGIDIELLADDQDSYKQFIDGNLSFKNNILFNISTDNFNISADVNIVQNVIDQAQSELNNHFTANDNVIADPEFTNFIPSASQVSSNLATPSATFFTNSSYKGAFSPSDIKWINDWTLLQSSGTVE